MVGDSLAGALPSARVGSIMFGYIFTLGSALSLLVVEATIEFNTKRNSNW